MDNWSLIGKYSKVFYRKSFQSKMGVIEDEESREYEGEQYRGSTMEKENK